MRRFLLWVIPALTLALTIQANGLDRQPFLGLLPAGELNSEQKEALDLLLTEYRAAASRADQRQGTMFRAFRHAAVIGEPDVDQQMARLIRMEAERLVLEAKLGEQIRHLLTPAQLEQIALLSPRSIVGAALGRAPQPDAERGHLVF